ncbi:hypothetical protein SEPCBS119000_005731 [Sporothrix epigloea]|uniref:HNH nuclease domain-containing protein n=1 Tax=Sporothrix epigloea TaxID=1892477 RepID=A0ABP0DZ44_9PEZI
MSSPSVEELVAGFQELCTDNKQVAKALMKLGKVKPEAVMVLSADIPYEFEPPLDYITDVEERQRLFTKIRPVLPDTIQMNSTVLAVFMVYPLTEMRSLCDSLTDEPTSSADLGRYGSSRLLLYGGLENAHKAIKGCKTVRILPSSHHSLISQVTVLAKTATRTASPSIALENAAQKRKRSPEAQPETPSPRRKKVLLSFEEQPASKSRELSRQKSPSVSPKLPENTGMLPVSPATRSRNAVKRAKERDGNLCILTGTDDPEAAHIFPFSAGKADGTKYRISQLATMWGDEKATAWKQRFLDPRVTESPKNLLCLNRQLHFYWGTSRLALKPIRSLDPCTIKVQLHWLRPSATNPMAVSEGSFDDISSLCGGENDFQSWGQPPVAHRKSGLPLQTGQIFTIRAEDPEDLPSFELLEMQWDLLRIAAMSGAAEPTDESSGEDEDEDGDEYGGNYLLSNVPDSDVDELDLNRTEAFESDTA